MSTSTNMTSTNMFMFLSTSVETSELPVKKVSGQKEKKVTKKKTPKTSAVTLKDEIADFEYDHPVGMILYHYDGKDRFLVFNFKISRTFCCAFSVYGVKKITLPAIQNTMNEIPKKLNDVVVWESYFEKETLERLTKQEYFKTPSEFEAIFDLVRVRDSPITHLGYSPVIIFDFRISNSKQEFVYLPNGSRVYFGKAFDDFRVEKRKSALLSIMKHYERSLSHFNLEKVHDACDEIFELTSEMLANKMLEDEDVAKYSEDREFADDAERFITKYVRLHDDDEQVELRNLLPFEDWPNDLKMNVFTRAMDYRNSLFKLQETVRKEVFRARELREKARELSDEEAYPSLS